MPSYRTDTEMRNLHYLQIYRVYPHLGHILHTPFNKCASEHADNRIRNLAVTGRLRDPRGGERGEAPLATAKAIV